MNINKAIAKLEKLGGKVEMINQGAYVRKQGKPSLYIGINPDGECCCFSVVRGYDNVDQEEVHEWRANLTRAIKAAEWEVSNG